MSERNVVAASLRSREAYDKVVKFTEPGEYGEQARLILDHIGQYYDADPDAQRTDPELVSASVRRSLANPKHRETFEHLISDLASQEVSAANVVKDLLGVKREASGSKLATALAAGRPPNEIVPLIDEYTSFAEGETLTDDETSVMHNVSIADVVRTTYDPDALIKVWPTALNDRLDGGCLPGHHIVIFARPEAGKTLTLVNMMAGFLYQGLRCLYVGNEDPVKDILLRVTTRLSGMDKYDVLQAPDKAEELARERGYENLILAELAPGTPREIEALIVQYDPDVVLIDQLRNINVGEEQFVQQLEKAATAARNLAKKHGVLMVSVTQAGHTADNKAVLDMGDVDSSKTGVPAQADVMIGIGGTEEDFGRNRRVLSLPKNKRGGCHEFFPVQIVPGLSKIRSVEEGSL